MVRLFLAPVASPEASATGTRTSTPNYQNFDLSAAQALVRSGSCSRRLAKLSVKIVQPGSASIMAWVS